MTKRWKPALTIAVLLGVLATRLGGEPPARVVESRVPTQEQGASAATRDVAAPLLTSTSAAPTEHHGSHPLTPERQWIQYENALVGALYDALDMRDAARIRELVATYRETQPDDEHALQQGFELIADCMDAPSDAARASAVEYYDRERASTIRRYVRRYCLEADSAL